MKKEVINRSETKAKAKKQRSYHIGGISVEFPYQPYGTQLAFMSRVISTLDRALKDGHFHALIESPTGTGKSLSLLCSVLAWQQSVTNKNIIDKLNRFIIDPIAHGGGFVPETAPENQEPSAKKDKASNKKSVPTVFYASRTHSQITQVIREYNKTSYRVPMAVLASKKHYCTNNLVRDNGNVDEDCKLLLGDRNDGCPHFKNVHKVKAHQSLQKGGQYEVHDIEDLLKIGHQMKGCSYFAARSMAEDAQLVFCPYSYIINPIIRNAMEVNIAKAILILDEAHNIEDMARDAGSVDAEEGVLHKLQVELGQLSCGNPTVYQPLHEMMMDLIEWMERKKDTLEKREFQHYFSCWTGDKALRELQEANMSQQCFPILQDCATKAFKATLDSESEEAHLSPMSATTLEGLFSSLSYFFSENGAHVYDYQLVLQRYIKKEAGITASDWTYTLSLWCLNPSIVFRNIANLSLSVILTSGTLSPMNSFSSELGVQFGTCLEAPHVIDVESQLWAAVISTGPDNYPLNASYKTADGFAFQDSLGQSLEEICKIVPGGALIFFPSYKLMDKLCTRWQQTGQWSRLNAQKPLFVEPRGNQEEFEAALTGYYDTINGKKKPDGRKRKGKKLGVKSYDTLASVENPENGAGFLAVFRGKVSEGIDFSDDKARVVIIVGIPFPNINDIQVAQKKKYNDTFKSSRNLLSGSDWYCQQAFRALNQAAGRCIRHKSDYGAVILLDERFCQERNTMYISKWLRKSMKQYNSFDHSLEELKSFFSEVKERITEAPSIAQNFEADVEKSSASKKKEVILTKKSSQVNNSLDCSQKLDSDCTMETFPICIETYDARFTPSKPESTLNAPREYIDLECSSPDYFRSFPSPSMKTYYDDPDLTVVQETPDINNSHNIAYKSETSSSTITQCQNEFSNELPSHTTSLTNSNLGPSKCTTHSLTTPEKYASVGTNCSLAESALNSSVNSHTQKRRRSVGSTVVNLIEAERFDSPRPLTPTYTSYKSSPVASIDTKKFKISSSLNSPSEEILLDSVTNERLQIGCSLCKIPLGLPENHFFVSCSIASTSKVYLTTLLKSRGKASPKGSRNTPVLICDISSVDHQLYNNRTHEGDPGQGIWCKEDGCVFDNILCPSCMDPDNCLGVRIMATDASNVQLLDKVLFFRDCLENLNLESSKVKEESIEKESKEKVTTPAHIPEKRTYAAPISIENFAFVPDQQKSDGWRTTRSKLAVLASIFVLALGLIWCSSLAPSFIPQYLKSG